MKESNEIHQQIKEHELTAHAAIHEDECDPCLIVDELWQSHAQQILDSKYDKQDLLRIAEGQKHLTKELQHHLHQLLKEYEDLFTGQLGEWPGEEVSVELRPDAVPYHCGKPICIPIFIWKL